MRSRMIPMGVVLTLALTTAAQALAPTQPGPAPAVAVVNMDSSTVWWQPTVDHRSIVLSVAAPDGEVFEREFAEGSAPFFSVHQHEGHDGLADGHYNYELRVVPQVDFDVRQALAAARESGDTTLVDDYRRAGRLPPEEAVVQTGGFWVSGGQIVVPSNEPEAPSPHSHGGHRPGLTPSERVGGGGDDDGGGDVSDWDVPPPPDQTILDDLIVDGSTCVGFDCVNGESFGFDTIRMKENNLRIHFDDTSVSASFPPNDWRLVANDTANGGASYLAIEDATAGRQIFRAEAGAPANSLYVDSGGGVGLGTSTPIVELHVQDGDSPTMRLEQDGSSGFTPQTFDVVANEANFFVRDATNGSTLPFRIQPGAATNTLYIGQDGVGFGTNSPDSPIHVRNTDINTPSIRVGGSGGGDSEVRIASSNETAELVIQETNGTTIDRTLVNVENNGNAQMRVANTFSGDSWRFGLETGGLPVGVGFVINNEAVPAGPEFRVQNNGAVLMGGGGVTNFQLQADGDLIILGALTQNSTRAAKEDIQEQDPRAVLDKLSEVPIPTWRYTKDEQSALHMGPMAEDFYAAFELGESNTRLAPSDAAGVALAAVKGLHEVVQEKDATIAELRARVDRLEGLIQRLVEDRR